MENIFEVFLGFGRTLYVFDGLDPLGHFQTLLSGDRGHAFLSEDSNSVGVVSEVSFVSHQNDGHARAVVTDLGKPFLLNVIERDWTHDREAHEKDVCLGVREWAESVIVLLPGRIPQIEADKLAINTHVLRIVIKPIKKRLYTWLATSY